MATVLTVSSSVKYLDMQNCPTFLIFWKSEMRNQFLTNDTL